jgi:hypothetical protein
VANILSASEAAVVLRVDETDPAMLQLLPLVDAHLKNATGHDWAADGSIEPIAKSAAQILVALWYENPSMVGQGVTSLNFGLTDCIVQLEALALRYRAFQGRNGAGPCILKGAFVGETVDSLVGLIGASGDQSAKFETVIAVSGEIQQTSIDDLSENWYRAHLVPLGDL